MKKESLRFERWISSEQEEEIHYFLGERYVFGYNPKLISPEAMSTIVDKTVVALNGASASMGDMINQQLVGAMGEREVTDVEQQLAEADRIADQLSAHADELRRRLKSVLLDRPPETETTALVGPELILTPLASGIRRMNRINANTVSELGRLIEGVQLPKIE